MAVNINTNDDFTKKLVFILQWIIIFICSLVLTDIPFWINATSWKIAMYDNYFITCYENQNIFQMTGICTEHV